MNGDCFAMKEGPERSRLEGNVAHVIYRLERFLMFQSSYSTGCTLNINEIRRVRRVIVA